MWAKQEDTVFQYTFRVSPPLTVMFTGYTSRQLTLSYNTEYNLSVVAIAPCRASVTAFMGLKYSELIVHQLNNS